jgi:undecaprenyl-diphosphatase
MTMIVACFIAVFAVRVLAVSTPFQVRPIHNADLTFAVPHDMDSDMLETWSSFPSDHAAMFFALAMSLWFISRSLGILSLIYVSVVICAPRVYLGLHYPTDMLVGAAVGIGAAWVVNLKVVRRPVEWCASRWLRLHAASFYAFFFFVTFQVAVMFDDVREIAGFVFHLLEVTMKVVG